MSESEYSVSIFVWLLNLTQVGHVLVIERVAPSESDVFTLGIGHVASDSARVTSLVDVVAIASSRVASVLVESAHFVIFRTEDAFGTAQMFTLLRYFALSEIENGLFGSVLVHSQRLPLAHDDH